MGRSFVVTNSNSVELGKKKKTIRREITIGPTAIKFISITIAAILAVVYLSQSTAGANRSIKVQDIENKKSDIVLERESLETEQARLRSLKTIDDSIAKPDMQAVSTVSTPTTPVKTN
jgi:hypothetical protein